MNATALALDPLALEDAWTLPTYTKPPVALVRGEGVTVWDTEGRAYLDFYGGHCVLVRVVTRTLVAALAGVQEVGREVGATGVGAVRGGIRAASDIGADLGHVATSAIRGTVEAAGELGGGAGSAARGTAGAVADVGADLGRIARRAVDGTRSAADRIGTAASRTVRSTMATTAQGVRGLLPSSPARRPTARTEGRGRGRRGAPAKSKRASKEPRSA
jgi:hypothetical protein